MYIIVFKILSCNDGFNKRLNDDYSYIYIFCIMLMFYKYRIRFYIIDFCIIKLI